jgi:hypothetical protein
MAIMTSTAVEEARHGSMIDAWHFFTATLLADGTVLAAGARALNEADVAAAELYDGGAP